MKILAISTFLIDQVCKNWVNKNLKEGESYKSFIPKLNLTNVKNRGMAFGTFSNKRGLLLVFSVVGLISLWGEYKSATDKVSKMGVSFMVGGGLSNVYDRVVKGEVTDYIYLESRRPTPIFNLADVFVLIGFLIRLKGYLRCPSKKNG